MAKALFVAYGGGHVNMILPVIAEMKRRGGWEVRALGLTTARAKLLAAGVPTVGFRDLLRPDDQEARSRGESLAAAHHDDASGIDREESVAYLGLSYVDLERRVGAQEAARRFAASGRQAFLPLGPLERLLKQSTPDLVVATNSRRAEEAAIRAARSLRLPSIVLVDLFGLEWGAEHLADPTYADRVTAPSEWVKTFLVGRGRRPEEIVVTGNPAFDRLASPDLPRRAEEWRRARGLQGKKIILWASSPEPRKPELLADILRTLIAALPRHPDWHLIYRRHPNESFLPIELPADASRSGPEDDLAVVLRASDVVTVTTSTVGMEGALLGRPLVKITLSVCDSAAPYEAMGIALPVSRFEDLEPQVVSALADSPEARGMGVARNSLPPAGGAAGRVADLLEQMAATGRP